MSKTLFQSNSLQSRSKRRVHWFPWEQLLSSSLRGTSIALSVLLLTSCFSVGCNDQSVRVPKLPASTSVAPPKNWDQHIGLANEDDVNEILLTWLKADAPADSKLQILPDELAELREISVFDSTIYDMDKSLVEDLRKATNLKWLRVGSHGTSENLQWICDLQQLQGLSLRWSKLANADIQDLASLSRLRWLDLSFAELPAQSHGVLGSLLNLEVLFLDGENITDDLLPTINLPNLKVFSASFSNISDQGLGSFLQANPQLRHLRLVGCSNISINSFESLSKLQDLRYLHIGSSKLENQLHDNQYFDTGDSKRTLRALQNNLPACHIGTGS